MNGKVRMNRILTGIALAVLLLTVVAVLEAAKKPKKKKPKDSELVENLVYQSIPTSVFASPAPDNTYFLSGWVCPGSGSAALALVTYSGGGKVIDSAGVEVASSSELTQLGFADEVGTARVYNFEHPDHPGEDFRYFRVFARFSLTSAPSIKQIRVLLQNTSNETASCSVWFDGIKLERAQNANQQYPTSYHSRANLLSPEFKETLEGGPQYYEW